MPGFGCYHADLSKDIFRMLPAILMIFFLLTWLLTRGWLHLASRQDWLDRPNHRSSHQRPTPKSGGVGFVVAYSLFVLLLYTSGQLALVNLLVVLAGLVLAVTGFLDDLHNLRITIRLGMQLLVVAFAVLMLGRLPELILPWAVLESAWLLTPLYMLGLCWLINLFNFMDGIDALAASEAIFFCLVLALSSGSGAGNDLQFLALGLAVTVSAFLYFNLPPARLFMGDLGSNYLGYLIGMLALLAIQTGVLEVWSALILLGSFIVDATFTLFGRIRSGGVWYHAHRSHAYQLAAIRLGSHGQVVAAMALINVFWLLPLAELAQHFSRWGAVIMLVAWTPLAWLVLQLRAVRVDVAPVPSGPGG
jgi:Fuc2NAc and GlcNAc transferase